MNEKAVKQLTEKGCIVEQGAAESLTSEDIERIDSLDSPPMYITEKMLSELRSNGSEKVKKEEKVEIEERTREEKGESLTTLADTGEHSSRTKVEVLDREEVSREEKDVPEFLEYYNDRYDRMKKMLMRRMELKSAVTIKRIQGRDEGEEVTTIGMVRDKYDTRSGKYIVEIEDKTSSFKVLVDQREGERIVPDEVIGVRGSNGGDIIYANSIIRPDLPIPDGINTTSQKVKAAYISDFHLGSKDTMETRLERFAEWLNSDEASKVRYLVMPGDMVEGVGVYPGQEEELEITDIYKQYRKFEEWVEKLPQDLQVIVGPGNHDIVRLAEPQPRIPGKALPNISGFDNVHLVQNPQLLRLHGIESQGILHLMYHGYSFDEHVDQIKQLRENAYDEPHHVMIDLLKRRHLAPTYGSNLLSPEQRDRMVIERKPDVMVSGHFHAHSAESYKGVNVICASTFQAQTDFQKRMGHEPQPGRVTLLDFKTRETEVKKF